MSIEITSSSYAQLAYIAETKTGEIPSTGKGTNLRMTGESMEMSITKQASNEISNTRQTSSLHMMDVQNGGGINFELSAEEYDVLLEAVMMGTWSKFGTDGVLAVQSIVVTYDVATDQSLLTITTSKNQDFTKLLAKDSYFRVVADNIIQDFKKPLRIAAVEPSAITVYGKLPNVTLDANVKLYHSQLRNGKKKRSFSIEKHFTDTDQTFVFTGMRANKLSLSFESKNVVTGSFDFIGNQFVKGQGNLLGDRTDYNLSKTCRGINTSIGMSNILIDGVDVRTTQTAAIQKMSLDYDNGMVGHAGLGVMGNVDVTAGNIQAEGTMSMYFNSVDIYDDIMNQVHHRFEFTAFDADGHGYAFIFPRIELKDPKTAVNAQGEAVMTDLGYSGLESVDGQSTTLIIERF